MKLFANQAKFLKKNKKFLKILSSLYSSYFDDYQTAETEACEHYDDPHIKRAMRILAFDKLKETSDLIDQDSLWMLRVEVKQKPEEWAKDEKYGRVVGDYGVEASLLGFRLTDFLKQAMTAEDVDVEGGIMSFCKTPDPLALKRHFSQLLDPSGRYYFLYFSDDSCLSIRNPDTGLIDRYNLDISGCDASHGPGLFREYTRLFPDGAPRDDALRLVLQCCLPVLIRSCGIDGAFVLLKCLRPFLYSGSTITTGLNNLACMLICLSIVQKEYRYTPDANGVNTFLVDRAAEAGYILTGCTPLKRFEDVQFLKNSPVLDTNGEWQPMLNFGVLLRASGTCRGDLPGRGDIIPRARSFQAGLLQGCYPKLRFEVLDVMVAATRGAAPVVTPEVEQMLAYKTCDSADAPVFTVDPASFCRRYQLTPLDYSELLHDFAPSGVGVAYHGNSVSKILKIDYGLETTENNPAQYLCVSYNTATTEAML